MKRRTITTTDGHTLVCLSRWIRLQCTTVTERHSLSQYAEEDGTLWFFRWNGRSYALGQFMRYGGPWAALPGVPMWDEDDGLHHMTGYDMTDYHHPIEIEMDECCEAVRVWQEVTA